LFLDRYWARLTMCVSRLVLPDGADHSMDNVPREALFHETVTKLRPYAIVETGTYLGTTTEFHGSNAGLPGTLLRPLPARRSEQPHAFWIAHWNDST
jgi:hypothetical protein